MEMYYVSHPFTGDEERNRREARKITAKLKTMYPKYIFINPLDAFQYAEGWTYEKVLENCIEMLCMCDGIIMTGYWAQSRGCRKERETAVMRDMEVTVLEEWI